MPDQDEATRAQLLRRTIVCGGAIVGGAPLGAAAADRGTVQGAGQRVLNLVLALEYVEEAFYEEALKRGGLQGELKEFAEIVGEHEKSHVAFLEQALGGAAEPAPRHDFGDKTKDAEAYTAAAVTLEDLAVATYNGQAVNLTPGVAEGGGADRVGGGPPRRVDPQHRR